MMWTEVAPAEPVIDRCASGWQVTFPDGTLKVCASLVDAVNVASGDDPIRTEGHIYSDESVVGHCVFCGSGDVVGRSDGSVECQLCHRSFVAMEQPIHMAQPAPDYQSMQIDGTGLEDPTSGDPIEEAPAFAPPQQPAVPPPGGDSDGPPSDDEEKAPPKTSALRYRTAKGHLLAREDFVRHVAIKFTRAANGA